MAYCCNKMVMQEQKSSFGRVIFGIGRLIWVLQGLDERCSFTRNLTMHSVILEIKARFDIGR